MPSSPAEKKNAGQLLDILAGRANQNRVLPSDFMELVIQRIGGPGELAKIVADILQDSKVAGVAKQRIISDLIRVMQHVETKSKPPADLSTFSSDDLRRHLAAVLGAIDGQVSAAESGPGPGPSPTSGAPAEAVQQP